MSEGWFIRKLRDASAYRLTEPEGNNRTVALLIDKLNDRTQNISMGLCIIDPRSQIPYHAHEAEEEAIFIIKGKGVAKIENNENELGESSVMFIPPKVQHQIINPNDEELSFLFIYGPSGPEQIVKTRGIPSKPIKPKW